MQITKDMGMTEILNNFPETADVFRELNLGCLGCIAAQFETLEQGLMAHGIDLESTLKKLNAAIANK